MPRELVIGNGQLLVCFDAAHRIRDLYWPQVGCDNHSNGFPSRIGVWADGHFRWTDQGFHRSGGYEEDTLVVQLSLQSPELQVMLDFTDCVYHRDDILLRRIKVTNQGHHSRQIRLFLHQDYRLLETDIGDTAMYDPFADAMLHYKRNVYILLAPVDSHSISSYATGIKGFNGREGTWRDAEDGELLRSSIDQGSVDSTIAFHLTLGPNESDTVDLALCCGSSRGKVLAQLEAVRKNGFMRLLDGTRQYWRLWCRRPDPVDHILGKKIGDFYRRSLLIMRTQIDNQGAILAANDTDIMSFHRAHYSYMWPRDGALVCATLDRAGYGDITRQFFRFCHRVLPPDKPAFYHKYAADGSVGSSWHPWLQDGLPERPIQEDETALVIWALWEHYKERLDVEFIESLYARMIVPCTSFLAAFRDPVMGLPQPSWDLWEERYGIHLFTCATVYAALLAGANFARMFGDAEQHFFKQAADELRSATLRHFWDADRGYFARMLTPKGGKLIADPTLDASCYAIFAFGMLPPEDARVVSTMAHLEQDLWVKTDLGGVARYQKDYYFRQSDDYERIPGNPWIICTLFLAQYKIAAATTLAELKRTTLPFLEWVMARANSGGLLPEQVHPENGAHLSVAPLTWSHAEFVNTCQKYCAKVAELKAGTLDVSRPAS